MANPQCEDGYTKIANQILERLYAVPLSGSEYRILFCILRKTYGWRKKADRISLSQLVTETKLSRKQVCEAVNKLVTKRLLFKHKIKNINEYEFNKDFEMWLVTNRLMGSYQSVTQLVTETTPKLVTEMEHTKEKKEIKEINTKERKKLLMEGLAQFKKDFGGIK